MTFSGKAPCRRTTQTLFWLCCLLWAGGAVAFASTPDKLARPSVSLHGVSFLTVEEGWVVGQLGKIFHTTDGGKSWEEQVTGTNLLLTAVDFLDRTHGWAVGERGAILHTEDGGRIWKPQQSGVLYPLFDVQFVDQDTGWAVGHWGTILYTKDEGKHWSERSLSLELGQQGPIEPAALQDIVDPSTGEVLAKAGQLLPKELVADIARRGAHGARVREDVVLNAVFFLDQQHGWIVGERGLVLRTTDGGENWERTTLPHPPAQSGAEGEEELMSEEELAAFGVVAPPPSLYGVFFVSPQHGWAVGQEGTIVSTHDGGRQWEFQPSGTQEALYDVGVAGDAGWVVGDKGSVLISTDNGGRWEKKELGLEYRLSWLRRLAVVPGDHAFLVGADGLVLASAAQAEGIGIHTPAKQ